MTYHLRLADFGAMTGPEQEGAVRTFAKLAKKAHDEGTGSPALSARIRRFEARYEMGSSEMRKRVAEGSLKETSEIAEWLFLLQTQDLCTA